MAVSMKATGKMIKPTGEEDLSMLMVTAITVIGLTIRLMVVGPTNIWTEPNTLEIGKKTNSTVMESKHGLMLQSTKVIMNSERSTVLVLSNGPTALHILENSIAIISMEREFTHGPMQENMKENGELTKCMARVRSHGQTAVSILVSMPKIRRRAMVNSYGLMVDATGESGLTENNMGKDHMLQVPVKRNMVNGKKANVSDGSAEEN
jgi:hypothetical protein